MAKKRGDNGDILDVPTYKPQGASSSGGSLFGDDTPTRPPAGRIRHPRAHEGSLYDDISSEATRPAKDKAAASTEPATQIFGRRSHPEASQRSATPQSAAAPAASTQPTHTASVDAMADPVAGWLVVIRGPGQGNFLKVGYGQNSVGREAGKNQRILLAFGDGQISRENHATIIYEPKGKQFFITPGTGTQLAYLMDGDTPVPVMAVTQLLPNQHILFGDTLVRFVQLCGPEFTWDDYVN